MTMIFLQSAVKKTPSMLVVVLLLVLVLEKFPIAEDEDDYESSARLGYLERLFETVARGLGHIPMI
jgi:hypothetical protein